MSGRRRTTKKPRIRAPKATRPRNPFAGRLQGGAGFHSEDRYSKKSRRKGRRELEEEIGQSEADEAAGQEEES